MGGKADEVKVTGFVSTLRYLEDLRFQNCFGIVADSLWSELQQVEDGLDVAVEAAHCPKVIDRSLYPGWFR